MTLHEKSMAESDLSESVAPRTSKEDWLNLALNTLISDGIDHVKIQVMAKQFDVSRSSFYWFFESLQDLHDQLLQHWLEKNTKPIIERALRPAPTITAAILNVFDCWVDDQLFDPKLDIAVRLWARRDEHVRSVVQDGDVRRLDALAKMFHAFGYDPEDGLVKARVIYYTQIGHYTLDLRESDEVRLSHARAYVRTFAGVEPTSEEVARFERFSRAITLAKRETGQTS